MFLSVPVTSQEKDLRITVVRQEWGKVDSKPTSLSVSPSALWFLIGDSLQITLCSFEQEDSYRVFGALVFRQFADDCRILSVIRDDGVVSDFEFTEPHPLYTKSAKNIQIDRGADVVHHSFFSSGQALIVSSSGSLGCIELDRDQGNLVGFTTKFEKLHDIVCASTVPTSSLAVLVTCNCTCGVVDISKNVLLGLTCYGFLLHMGPPTSCASLIRGNTDAVDVVLTFSTKGGVYAVRASRKTCDDVHTDDTREYVVKFQSVQSTRYTAHSYITHCGSCVIVASVWQDMVQFAVWNEKELRSIATVENDVYSPYISGFWSGQIFIVIRADGVACPLFVTHDENNPYKLDIVPQEHLNLQSSNGALLCGNSSFFLLLVVKDAPALWAGVPNNLFVTDNGGYERTLTPCGVNVAHGDVLLTDVTLSHTSIALAKIYGSGECMGFILSNMGSEMILLGREDKPEDVTSCLVFAVREKIVFVTGNRDGSLHVWSLGKLTAVLHQVHPGEVDKLISLPTIDGTEEWGFVSVCTRYGSAVIHESEECECLRILQAPCSPLTNLVWDKQTECAVMVSGAVGSLWHVPTCHLERVLETVPFRNDTAEYLDLLSCSPRSRIITVDKISLCGQTHISLIVNVALLLEALSQVKTIKPSGFELALSILFSGISGAVHGLDETLRQLDVKLCRECAFTQRPVSTAQSVSYLLTVFIISKMLTNRTGITDQNDTQHMCALSKSLIDSGKIAEAPTPEDMIMGALPLILQFSELTRQAVRDAVRVAVKQLSPQRLSDLLAYLAQIFSTPRFYSWFRISHTTTTASEWCYKCFVRVAVVSETEVPDTISTLGSAISELKSDTNRFNELIMQTEEEQPVLLLLVILREYYSYLADNIFNDLGCVVDTLASLAFEKDGKIGTSAVKTLLSVASVEGSGFVKDCVKQWYDKNVSWRPRIIAFFGSLIEEMPVLAYMSFSIIKEIVLRALDPHNPNKEERCICALPVLRMIRLAVCRLPSVSFQQQMQLLAIGNTEGVVEVIDLKTTALVACFSSHPEAILCLSYSSDTSSHNIAVLSNKMDMVKVWQARRPKGFFEVIFSGSTIDFHLKTAIDVPKIADHDSIKFDHKLLIKCTLKWLSPHCLELYTPWHDKVQLAVV
ncbi:hypothetical protein ERJ75_000881200 [Trypanosoma vivax]|nr:hypothetical protein TRVL_06353 [Trypanosoma vivax]KAH8612628.1 hypothetical protein ERJ75_000881200 [Trypanosoma vivax]